MSVNLLGTGLIPVSCSSLKCGGTASFSDQAVSGVFSLSGGDAAGLLVNATAGPLRMFSTAGGRAGTCTANSNTPVAVACAGVTANSVVLLTVKTATGAQAGLANVVSVTPTTGFSIVSGAADTSVYNYVVIDNA